VLFLFLIFLLIPERSRRAYGQLGYILNPPVFLLLIAPQGIEINKTCKMMVQLMQLLIAPQGIEIMKKADKVEQNVALLIAPQGIEIAVVLHSLQLCLTF